MRGGKPYQFAILVGRFQVFHLGHADMIGKALELAERVGILIGSSQEKGTVKNPLSYERRKAVLQAVLGDKVEIRPLPDIGVGNNSTWGDYVLDRVEVEYGCLPDLLVSGREGRRVDWFDNERGRCIAELYVPKTIEISATEMRRFLADDQREQWQSYTDSRLWDFYPEMRRAVCEAEGHFETSSL